MAGNLGLSLDGGSLQKLSGSADLAEITTVMNEIIDSLNAQLQTTVQSDQQSKRFVIGYQKGGWPGGNFGIKISKEGVDVTTATTSQLLFSWDFTTGNQYHYGGTDFWYDPTTGKNYMQEGILPDNTGGFAVADVGKDVSEGF